MDVLESEHLLQARLANSIAFAALHSHPAADIEKGAQQVGTMYMRALDAIPYLTGGVVDNNDGAMRDRVDAVKRYKKMQAERGQA